MASIMTRLRESAPRAAIIQVAHRPLRLVNATGQSGEISQLAQTPIAAFCGIGNPEGFRRTLESCGWHPTGFREYADHHAFSTADVTSLTRWAESLQVDTLICTRKDLVKIAKDRLGEVHLWALEIGIEILSGREDLEERLQSLRARIDPREDPGPR